MFVHPDLPFIDGARRHADALDRAARERGRHANRSARTATDAPNTGPVLTDARRLWRTAFRF